MLILGVDGGGTKTAAMAVDETGSVVGWGLGGGSNYHTLGIDTMESSVTRAVTAALSGSVPDAVCYCMAAADMPHDFAQLDSRLNGLIPNRPYSIRNDVIGIFRAGSRFSYGVGVVSGTGFNAGGIDRNGQEYRFPALGAITGDYAGGEHLTMRAIGAAFRAADGRGEPTALSDAILKILDAPDYDTLAERYVQHELTPPQVKALAPMVFEVSEQGDPVARRLVCEEGTELGVSARAILRKLNLTDVECDVVLGGSICLGKGNVLIDAVSAVVHEAAPKAVIRRLDVPPVVGAVLLAADQLGLATDARFLERLRETIPREMRVPNTDLTPAPSP